MCIETVSNRTSPPAVWLRKRFRDEQGRAQTRSLANLSKLPGATIEGLKVLLKGGTAIGTAPQAMQIERALPHGHVAVALGTLRKIALDHRAVKDGKSKKGPASAPPRGCQSWA